MDLMSVASPLKEATIPILPGPLRESESLFAEGWGAVSTSSQSESMDPGFKGSHLTLEIMKALPGLRMAVILPSVPPEQEGQRSL
jgi:hypothetical protein